MSGEQLTFNRERIVAIASDVLSRVRQYQWCRGTYLGGILRDTAPLEGDLQQHVDAVQQHCELCLLGACLVSKARLFNNVPIGTISREHRPAHTAPYVYVSADRTDIKKLLKDSFPPLELSKIESAFECEVMGDEAVFTDEEMSLLRGAAIFGKQYDDDDADRVMAVMENIIDNNGEFVVDPADEGTYYDICDDDDGYSEYLSDHVDTGRD